MNLNKLKINIRPRAAASDTATIDIDGEIGSSFDGERTTDNTPEAISRQLIDIERINADKIIVNINSPGGFVDDGLAIYDVLRSHPAHIETRVFGMTASAGTIIAQAGDIRKMSENSLYKIQRAWGIVIGNSFHIKEFSEELREFDFQISELYADRSGKSRAKILMIMNENEGSGRWMDSQQAKDLGLIDQTFEPMKLAASFSQAAIMSYGIAAINREKYFNNGTHTTAK